MSIKKPIVYAIAGLGIIINTINARSATYEEAKEKLNVASESMIERVDDYYMASGGMDNLRIIAGIYAGTIKVSKKVEGKVTTYTAKGYYSQMKNPEAMKKAAENADADGDGIITDKEIQNLERKVCR